MNAHKLLTTSITTLLIISGCTSEDINNARTPANLIDLELKDKISELDLTGDPSTTRTLPDISNATAQLGMKLFFSKGLSGNQDSACVSCHHPVFGGGDNLSLPIGVEAEVADLLGPGRNHSSAGTNFDGGPTVPRNAPTTFNLGLWDKFLLHDGRVESLDKLPNMNGAGRIRTPDSVDINTADPDAGSSLAATIPRFPVTDQVEMRGHTYAQGPTSAIRTALEQRLQGISTLNEDLMPYNRWQQEFDNTFGQSTVITFPLIAEAIGEYLRSQVFVNNPWQSYVKGNISAISDDAKQGALLFFRTKAEGGANCASCHTGDFFTDESFHVTAMPQLGRGKGDGPNGTDDFGRYRESGNDDDKYAFRTPSLLNTEMYGPWGHAGGYTKLESVVKHFSNPQLAIDQYDFNQLDSSIQINNLHTNTQLAMDQLAANRTNGTITPILEDSNLSDTQISQIVSFLKTLTDPCIKSRSCLSPWIPNTTNRDLDDLTSGTGDTNPDGLSVKAFDQYGKAM